MGVQNPVEIVLEKDEAAALAKETLPTGWTGSLVQRYNSESSNLLGFILDMSYDEATIVTCDAWKLKCGGVPKNSFVLIRLGPNATKSLQPELGKPVIILARILQAVPTPLSSEIQQTIFTIHKVQAVPDPYTSSELQWGALKATILGTYYDDDEGKIAFGNDIDSYVSPHFYEVYVPEPSDLEVLINTFVSDANPIAIGRLRYTETQTAQARHAIPIKVSPADFIANRTALFGKTRMGKSNTIKVIADMMIRSGAKVGQVVFDLNGEYSNFNEQDNTSIFDLHRRKCVRYSLNPDSRTVEGVEPPRTLKVDFYRQVELGHSVMTSLFDAEHGQPPKYLLPLLNWEPVDEEALEERFPEEGDRKRFIRARSMYFAALSKAGFVHATGKRVPLILRKEIRVALGRDAVIRGIAQMSDKSTDAEPEIADTQPLKVAIVVYEKLYRLHQDNSQDPKLFPASPRTGDPYFNEIHKCLLQMLGDGNVSGTKYLIPFNKYHDPNGANIIRDIVGCVDTGQTVLIDLANADEIITGYYSKLVSKAIFQSQVAKFTKGTLGDHSVLFYFEEAHNLFNKDDKDLRSIYNRLAKEGGKNRIGMVYATQSMTTLSPDLLKNTENFFIAHLNDDREIRELTSRYEFRDIGLDVQRCKTKGYVRMITLSHRYALPVQIRKFERPAEE